MPSSCFVFCCAAADPATRFQLVDSTLPWHRMPHEVSSPTPRSDHSVERRIKLWTLDDSRLCWHLTGHVTIETKTALHFSAKRLYSKRRWLRDPIPIKMNIVRILCFYAILCSHITVGVNRLLIFY